MELHEPDEYQSALGDNSLDVMTEAHTHAVPAEMD
jgi:hypothetical protein